MVNDILHPSTALLAKLGSIYVHVDEMLSDDGHALDRVALDTIMQDTRVKAWIAGMQKIALVPLKR